MVKAFLACVIVPILVAVAAWTKMGAPRILIVGAVTQDLVHGDVYPGGAVTYAAAVARALGVRACIVYSDQAGAPAPEEFAGHFFHLVPANATLQFEHTYTFWGNKRKLRVTAHPSVMLSWDHVPPSCRHAKMILLGPLVPNDIDVASFTHRHVTLVHRALGLAPKICLVAQGLQRRLDPDSGAVSAEPLPSSTMLSAITPRTTVFLSDVETDVWPSGSLETLAKASGRLLITRGPDGADEITAERMQVRVKRHPAHQISQVLDTNGAGDSFATAYAVALSTGKCPSVAAQLANFAGAMAVEQPQDCKPGCIAEALRLEKERWR